VTTAEYQAAIGQAFKQDDGTYRDIYGNTTDAQGNIINATTDPSTQAGSGTYGAVAGSTALPSASEDLSAVYPNLTASNQAAADAALSELQGNVSQATQNNIQDAAARWGISSGMGANSGIGNNLSLRDLGLNTEALQQQGISDYAKLLSTIDNTQTVSPETQIGLSQSNNALAATANPQDATDYALSLYNKYLSNASTGGASTTGAVTTKLAGNAGGSGTTSPFQVTGASTPITATGNGISAGASGGGSGIASTGAGTYVPVTGNTYGGLDTNDPSSGSGLTYMGENPTNTDQYDWEAMLSDYGL